MGPKRVRICISSHTPVPKNSSFTPTLGGIRYMQSSGLGHTI